MTAYDRTAMAALALVSAPACAQEVAPPFDDSKTIVVTAERIPGSVKTDVPPTLVLNPADIEGLGASSTADLLSSIGAQTKSGGRSNGPPVVLLNGRRVSNFGELRDIPPEAILRVEVFPEEVGLKLGYSPDQRIVNMILKPGFSAKTLEVEQSGPTRGGRAETEGQAALLQVTKTGRINLSAQYNTASRLTEDERGIVQPGLVDTGPFRTLLPRGQALALNGVYNRAYKNGVGFTLNGRYNFNKQGSLLGLVTGGSRPIARDDTSNTYSGGLTVDGNLGRWTWTLTANLSQTDLTTRTVQDSVIAGRDIATSRITNANGLYSITGSPFRVPAGDVTLNVRAGFDQLDFKSSAQSLAGNTIGAVSRGIGSGRVNIDVPITSRRENFGDAIGTVSLNGNYGYKSLTDFGSLYNYGYGLTWSPIEQLTATATYTAEDAAPSPQQLGDPRVITPNVPVFDFVRGQTALVSLIRGGNPLLTADKRRDVKFGLSWSPPWVENLGFEANYFRVRSTNPISSFPSLSVAAEQAFPGRVVRDAGGRLIALDQRAVNFAETRTNSIRWGFNFFKSFGQSGGMMGMFGGGGRRPAGAPSGAQGGGARPAAPPPGGRPGGGGGGFGAGRFGPGARGGSWFLSAYHSITLADEAVIARGQQPLDLLRGDSIGGLGGSARHSVEVQGGWFANGFGVRVTGGWSSASTVRTGINTLRFSSLGKLDLRAFLNFDQRKKWVKAVPFLKGSRLSLRLLNATNAIQSVRDGTGAVPFRYQPGYVDAAGRTFEISFRKIF
jgi:iron complex outermembrane recepter protein